MSNENKVLSTELSTAGALQSNEAIEEFAEAVTREKDRVKVLESAEEVEEVVELVENLEDHELTPGVVEVVSETLIETGDDYLVEVAGTESLGYNLRPSEWRLKLVDGSENFLSNVVDASGNLFKDISNAIHDSKVLIGKSVESSTEALELLKKDIKGSDLPSHMSNRDLKIDLGQRLANTFMLNKKLDHNWGVEFKRLENNLKASLATINYSGKDDAMIISQVFGGLEKAKTEADVLNFMKAIPKAIKHVPLREAKELYTPMTCNEYNTTITKPMVGDRYFTDTIVKAEEFKFDQEEFNDVFKSQFREWLSYFNDFDGIKFHKPDERLYDGEFTIPLMGKDSLLELTDRLLALLKLCDELNRRASDDIDRVNYRDMLASFEDLPVENHSIVKEIKRAYNTLVSKQSMKNGKIRNQVTNYVALLVNGFVNLAYQNMETYNDLTAETED